MRITTEVFRDELSVLECADLSALWYDLSSALRARTKAPTSRRTPRRRSNVWIKEPKLSTLLTPLLCKTNPEKGGDFMSVKDTGGDVASSQRPRSPRVPVEFALDVEGTDAAGKSFQATAKAVKISRAGATLLIDVDVAVGSTVKLVPPFGGKLNAEVNGSWVDDIDGNRRIGVKLLDANGWFAE